MFNEFRKYDTMDYAVYFDDVSKISSVYYAAKDKHRHLLSCFSLFNIYEFIFVTNKSYKVGDYYSVDGYTFKINATRKSIIPYAFKRRR